MNRCPHPWGPWAQEPDGAAGWPIAIDLETTPTERGDARNAAQALIVEAAVVYHGIIWGKESVSATPAFTMPPTARYVVAHDQIPEELTAIHGWTAERSQAEQTHTAAQACAELCARIACAPQVIGHNVVEYDIPVIERECIRHGLPLPQPKVLLDTMVAARAERLPTEIRDGRRRYTLADCWRYVAEDVGWDGEEPRYHGAVADAMRAWDIAYYLGPYSTALRKAQDSDRHCDPPRLTLSEAADRARGGPPPITRRGFA